ncbi:MAG: hypothetical protein MH219_13795 [Marinobacter sp.]|nr:hypothetical protein [Marinobacter sp.]
MVLGIELPQSHYYPYKFESLKEGHRERLLKIYYQNMRRIPDNAQLSLPMHRTGAKLISMTAKPGKQMLIPPHQMLRRYWTFGVKHSMKALKLQKKA